MGKDVGVFHPTHREDIPDATSSQSRVFTDAHTNAARRARMNPFTWATGICALGRALRRWDMNVCSVFAVVISRRGVIAHNEVLGSIRVPLEDGTSRAISHSAPNRGGRLPNNLGEVRGHGIIRVIT